MYLGASIFWIVVGLIVLSLIWTSFLRGRDTERTIRLAIEKGHVLDASTIQELKSRSEQTPAHLVIGGVILLALALGAVVFAFAAAHEDTDVLLPILGIAAMLALTAISLLACGLWLMRQRKTPTLE